MDNGLAKAQGAIGESSNLAQICLTYMYNFDDKIYEDALCILSVLAQVAIDNAKRSFAIDVMEEIKLIKQQINVKENKYPLFWLLLHPSFNKKNIDSSLVCPMNYLYSLKLNRTRSEDSTLPMDYFFVNHVVDSKDKRKNKKVEELIDKYSIDLLEYNKNDNNDTKDEYLLLRNDFEEMIEDIKSMYISKTYVSLFSWLINRAFLISAGVKRNKGVINTINKNKSLLLKTLYEINKDNLLNCFKRG